MGTQVPDSGRTPGASRDEAQASGPRRPQPLHPASPPPTARPRAGDARAAGLRAAERRPLPQSAAAGEKLVGGVGAKEARGCAHRAR